MSYQVAHSAGAGQGGASTERPALKREYEEAKAEEELVARTRLRDRLREPKSARKKKAAKKKAAKK